MGTDFVVESIISALGKRAHAPQGLHLGACGQGRAEERGQL